MEVEAEYNWHGKPDYGAVDDRMGRRSSKKRTWASTLVTLPAHAASDGAFGPSDKVCFRPYYRAIRQKR
eukprot:12611827-Prorocentrum_lima.AAC.1